MNSWDIELEKDFDWRVDELASLKHQVLRQQRGTLAERSLLRAMLAMLYAHYEGFCLFAFTLFLERIKQFGNPRHHHQESLVVFSLRKTFKKVRGNYSGEQCYQFFKNDLATLLREAIDFDRYPRSQEFILQGRSNLKPTLLAENCSSLCLSVPAVEDRRTQLWQLVDRRNKIAHGQSSFVRDLNEYEVYENAAYEVMLELVESVSESLKRQEYLVPELRR